ncbi:hypothetical protein [Jatrophihabitans endophyticus]|uniref:hypothetical protein n=1 Tax=Jatrophihabitans endophyticus TaxID=1206085 RepID=UPI0019DB039C|nr:hypothetical protein [Jatrophihabitans endophyticus]MBE7190778.1 hypothetical protein [Jatrophihabitans endophyticus]
MATALLTIATLLALASLCTSLVIAVVETTSSPHRDWSGRNLLHLHRARLGLHRHAHQS